ncbi:zinc finger protein [Saccharopolyspora elongata]
MHHILMHASTISREASMLYRAHPFHWVPAAGLRHASTDRRPDAALAYPTGTSVSPLCRQRLSADNSELAWLWSTCRDCDAEAHRIARTLHTPATERSK